MLHIVKFSKYVRYRQQTKIAKTHFYNEYKFELVIITLKEWMGNKRINFPT